MPRLNKLRKKQKFSHNRNRKRIRKTQEKHKSKSARITCDVLKEEWDAARPVKTNLESMGLVFNANSAIKNRSTKRMMVDLLAAREKKPAERGDEEEKEEVAEEPGVVQKLRTEAASYVKKNTFRLPAEDVRWITSMMDKHGDDFKAMARDPDNLFQLTPKQIRQKVAKFVSVREQFEPYAKERGLLEEADQILQSDV